MSIVYKSHLNIIDRGGVLVVNSKDISSSLNIQHESIVSNIEKYKEQLERFGQLLVELGTVINSVGARNVTKSYLLNEEQAAYLMTLSRNTPVVIEMKFDLVNKFFKAREVIKQATQYKINCLIGPEDTEKRIQSQLVLLSSFSGIRLYPEYTVEDNRKNFRSYDLLEFQNGQNKVIVYELKHPILQQCHISEIQGERRYLQLAHQRFPGKNVHIVFSAFGAEQYALDQLYCQPHYSYMNIYTLADRLYNNAINRLTPNARKFRATEYLHTFSEILSPGLITKEKEKWGQIRQEFYAKNYIKAA